VKQGARAAPEERYVANANPAQAVRARAIAAAAPDGSLERRAARCAAAALSATGTATAARNARPSCCRTMCGRLRST
jgi:hypothetical protein